MSDYKKNKKIVWTLQNPISDSPPIKNYNPRFEFIHKPLIELKYNGNFKKIDYELQKYKNIIITSPFAASTIAKLIKKDFHNIFTVGNKSSKIFTNLNFKVDKIFPISQDLSDWIRKRTNDSFIHLCSEKSNFNVWPSNVYSFPFYKPVKNKNIDMDFIKKISNSTVVFGSPSGVETWFSIRPKKKNNSYVCMGSTTAEKIKEYTSEKPLFPNDSKLETLLRILDDRK